MVVRVPMARAPERHHHTTSPPPPHHHHHNHITFLPLANTSPSPEAPQPHPFVPCHSTFLLSTDLPKATLKESRIPHSDPSRTIVCGLPRYEVYRDLTSPLVSFTCGLPQLTSPHHFTCLHIRRIDKPWVFGLKQCSTTICESKDRCTHSGN